MLNVYLYEPQFLHQGLLHDNNGGLLSSLAEFLSPPAWLISSPLLLSVCLGITHSSRKESLKGKRNGGLQQARGPHLEGVSCRRKKASLIPDTPQHRTFANFRSRSNVTERIPATDVSLVVSCVNSRIVMTMLQPVAGAVRILSRETRIILTRSRYAASFEQRCQHMDELYRRLEGLAKTLSECIQATYNEDQRPQETDLTSTEQNRHHCPSARSLTRSHRSMSSQSNHRSWVLALFQRPLAICKGVTQLPRHITPRLTQWGIWWQIHMLVSSKLLAYLPLPWNCADQPSQIHRGSDLNMMIEAVQSLSPEGAASKPVPTVSNGDVALPFFIQGQVWSELPYLPQSKDLGKPPQYIADLLVGVYFDQLHYTFPILYKPDFMRRYQQMKAVKRDAVEDRGFLSVFFAVCACASSLLPRAGNSSLPGIEYYQKAPLLQFASTGEAFIEQVQCLGLLALCSAGWNTLSQSWGFAGQAVRVAQDLRLHVSSLVWMLNPSFRLES